MKLISRNVNGIRAVLQKGFLECMQQEKPDIVCLQETKAFLHQMPPEMRMLPYQYICWHAGQRPGYAGTAILSVGPRHNHANTFDHSQKFHEDGRVTEVEYDGFALLNVYFPNGQERADGTEMLTYKLRFYDELIAYIQEKRRGRQKVVVVGDFNICHTEKDIARPKENQNSIGFLPEERAKIGQFMRECGLVDVFRHFYPDQTEQYTRWSYRAGARPRNVGRRLDYAMVSDDLVDSLVSFRHRQDIMGSDHCPIELVLQ